MPPSMFPKAYQAFSHAHFRRFLLGALLVSFGTAAQGSRGDMNGFKLLLANKEGLADYVIGGSYRGKIRNPATPEG